MSAGMGINPDECAELMIYALLGTEKGYRCVDNKGETERKKKQADESMIDKVWQHTSIMIIDQS